MMILSTSVHNSLIFVLSVNTLLLWKTSDCFVPSSVSTMSRSHRMEYLHRKPSFGDDPRKNYKLSSIISTRIASSSANAGTEDGISFSPGEATQRLGISTGPTVWTEFGRIAEKHNPVNLGQGFPDWLPPKFAVDSLVEAVLDSAQSPHQYTRPAGHPNLVKQLARRYSIHLKHEVNPMEEVAVTVGASQALYLSLQTLIQPGTFLLLPFLPLSFLHTKNEKFSFSKNSSRK